MQLKEIVLAFKEISGQWGRLGSAGAERREEIGRSTESPPFQLFQGEKCLSELEECVGISHMAKRKETTQRGMTCGQAQRKDEAGVLGDLYVVLPG